jgi:hypothetical protein
MKSLLILLILISVVTVPSVHAVTRGEVELKLGSAYSLVANAEARGGDVSDLVRKLNEAATLANLGDSASLDGAISLIQEVEASVSIIENSGARAVTFQHISIAISLVILGIDGLVVYLYGNRIFWSLWLRTKKGWRAEAT